MRRISFVSFCVVLVGSFFAPEIVFSRHLLVAFCRVFRVNSTLCITTKPNSAFPPPAPAVDDSHFGSGIQRTMTLLATSTPEHRHPVRILFYGQSITQQKWWQDVANDIKRRFPYADLIIENRAIGGFAAPLLIRPAEHDLYPFYPDLMIFHVYGGDNDYEAIIANVRRRTTSEIAFHSDHVTWLPTGTNADDPEKLRVYQWHDDHSTQWLPKLADKYGCEMIEIREPWKRYLKDNNLLPKDLLSDGVHLNDWGNFLLASLVKPHLRYDPTFPNNLWKNLVRTYVVGTDVQWKDGKLILEFEGNRVDAIAKPILTNKSAAGQLNQARVFIDGKKPSEFPELYSITRPSNAVGVSWPAILQVSWEKPLLVEDWTARITEIDADANKFNFEVFGSKTGFDGSGVSNQKFVSHSGRVVIEPRNWWLKSAYKYSGKPIPTGFQIKWQVKPMFVDMYVTPQVKDSSRESFTTLAQNLSNSRHRLEIIPDKGGIMPIQSLRVYQPPLK
jgi:hypothetical protein